MANRCSINTTDLEFLPADTNSSILQVSRWMNFCRAVYVDKCDMYSLTPRPRDIPAMFRNASYDDCFDTRTLIAYCISIILSSAIICTNTTILVVFFRNRSLRTCSNVPIMSLAISDFLTGVAFTYSSIWNLVLLSSGYEFDIQKTLAYIRMRTNYFLCLTLDGTGLLFTCLMSSVLTLGVIAVERHIGIFYPFKYSQWITTRRMVRVIVTVWVVSLIVGILPLCGWNKWTDKCQLTEVMDYSYIVLWTSICFLSGVIMLYIYMRIFILSRRHSRQIAAVQVSSQSCSVTAPSTLVHDNTSSDAKQPLDDQPVHKTTTDEETERPNATEQTEVETGSIIISIQGLKKTMFSIPSKRDEPEQHNTDPGVNTLHNTSPTPPEIQNLPIIPERRPSNHHKPSRRALVTTTVILGAFYLSWSPLLVFLVAFDKVTITFNLTVYYLAVVTQFNSVFNPIVYSVRNPDIKEALLKLFRCRN
ncbi:probable G-protein coupled receptor No18 [Mizuhopecten yessoensis]|uniref:Octopamine receptor n=1 Tax=Mizuhopecten yessoensis TaxID=6573 RepID=A0A210QJR2_MIZYE|nr:probable G-protein coupled receptor No18 [Mizuhopecten yessoensis]OWF48959.1 Octopamine receptor [Mizuhopecten yessoensis]